MTKDLPQQGINNLEELKISIQLALYLRDSNSNDRLEQLKAIDIAASQHKVKIVDLKIPFFCELEKKYKTTNENLVIARGLTKLRFPDEEQMRGLFYYVFEEKKCDPKHVIKVQDHPEIAKSSFNEINKNMYVNTFLHTLIVNEHRFASGNSLVEYVLDLPHIKKNFNFNQKDKIIEGPEQKEKDGKTILCLAAKMKEAVIVKKLCALKKAGCDINLDLEDEHGHTALFYSCALGDLESTNALLEAGAKPNLVDQTSIDSFRNNPTAVANILKSVAIDPERDEKAKSNNFVRPDNHQPDLDDLYKINKGNEKNIIAYINLIKDEPTEEQLSLKKEAHDELIQFTRIQILDSEGKSFLTGKSLLNSCLEGQAKSYKLLLESLYKANIVKNIAEPLKARFKEFLGETKDLKTLATKVVGFLDIEINKPLINRLETLKIIDEEARKKGIEINKIYPVAELNFNFLVGNSFDSLAIPDEKQSLDLFKYVFEEKKCNPNHGFVMRRDRVGSEHGFNTNDYLFFNSWLDTLIANESISIRDIPGKGNSHIVESVLSINSIQDSFDFNKKSEVYTQKQDQIGEKTPLILAAMMKKSGVVGKLCSLNDSEISNGSPNKKVDIDITDGKGNTALFYACALGDLESVKSLINASGDDDRKKLNDKQKFNAEKALNFCLTKEEDVRAILESVGIDPNRDKNAFQNNFVNPVGNLPKYDNSYKARLENKDNIEKFISELPRILEANSDQIPKESHDEIIKFAELQIKHLTGKSLLKSCLEGQVECREFLMRKLGFELAESPPGSVFSPEGSTQ